MNEDIVALNTTTIIDNTSTTISVFDTAALVADDCNNASIVPLFRLSLGLIIKE